MSAIVPHASGDRFIAGNPCVHASATSNRIFAGITELWFDAVVEDFHCPTRHSGRAQREPESRRCHARSLLEIPAFAGMTMLWFDAVVGLVQPVIPDARSASRNLVDVLWLKISTVQPVFPGTT